VVELSPFNLTFSDDPLTIWGNINPHPKIPYRGVAEGYIIFITNLSPGLHKIEYKVVDALKGKNAIIPDVQLPSEGSYEILVKQ